MTQEPSRSPPPHGESRVDPRVALAVQAVVEFDGLQARSYGVCEISRGGMFLAFKDTATTLREYDSQGIEVDSECVIAFSVSLPHHRQHLRIEAKIVRITEHGIGVKFIPRNPPQLVALKRLFDRVERGL